MSVQFMVSGSTCCELSDWSATHTQTHVHAVVTVNVNVNNGLTQEVSCLPACATGGYCPVCIMALWVVNILHKISRSRGQTEELKIRTVTGEMSGFSKLISCVFIRFQNDPHLPDQPAVNCMYSSNIFISLIHPHKPSFCYTSVFLSCLLSHPPHPKNRPWRIHKHCQTLILFPNV